MCAALTADGGEPVGAEIYENAGVEIAPNRIDDAVLEVLKQRGITPANVCSDEVFLRRVYVDVIGTLPEYGEVEAFLNSDDPDKRSRLIDQLLRRDEFADYWSLKWCDLLRVKAEFPINLWPNAVQAYHHWIRASIAENKPYDQFARELLTSSGSNFRVPAVNFYRAIQGKEPATIARAAALTFMGTRLEHWPQQRQEDLAHIFSRVAYKPTAEWKEEIVYLNPEPLGPLDAVLPDGTRVRIEDGDDPRRMFADWLITDENPWFARCIVNRVWSWLMGRGIIHEPDDIRPDNPPVNPELLDYLAAELVKSGYDLRHIYRLILNSRTYQQSSIPRSEHEDAEALFACYAVRRMDAEVLIDAVSMIFGTGEEYSSAIPEPFTFIPERERTIRLADGSISSQYLEMFGRPSRDTGLESERSNKPTAAQRLYLLNSSHIQRKIENSGRLRELMQVIRRNPPRAIRDMYVTILSRYPTGTESATALEFLRGSGRQGRG